MTTSNFQLRTSEASHDPAQRDHATPTARIATPMQSGVLRVVGVSATHADWKIATEAQAP